MTRKMPKLGDVQVSRMQFGEGDRALVRSHHRLSSDEKRKIRRTVAKWAGIDESQVLVFSLLDMEISKT